VLSLEAELATLRAAVEGCFDAFYLLRSVRDEVGQIVDFVFVAVNAAGLRELEMEREALIGQRLCVLFPVNLRAGFFEQYRRVAETREPLEQEFQLYELLVGWFQHQVVPAGDGVAIVMRRIGERKREQQEREALREELMQAQKMDSLGRLAGGIAHDFNNLLTPILAYANMGLMQLQPGEPLYEELDEIRQAADRATGLIRQILTFSRKQSMQILPVAVNRLIEGLARMLRRLVGDEVEVLLQLAPDAGNVLADPSRIEQILINLVINARDAILGEGKVTIGTRNLELAPESALVRAGMTAGSYVQLEVRDTGSGMSPEVQRRVFEPFFTTKAQVKGTGLGLAIVYGLVKQHGGDIRCDSEPGRGTTFRVLLPRTDEPLYSDDDSQAAPAIRPVERATETVLLVEDDEAVRKLTRHLLVARGYTVLEADNGMSALRVADGYPGGIDLLLTDVIMPRLGGPQLFARLVLLRPGLKVVYMSGFAEVETGGAPFLAKPFAGSRLLRTIEDALARLATGEA
jgi:two-component system cell cycle sensor histidine kinase/response regulator CckA